VEGLLPQEIKDFFLDERGGTLLIKGPPGAGKTCFAFTLLRDLGRSGVYLSTRVDPETVYGQLDWLKEVLPEESIIDATQSERQRTTGTRETAMIRPLKYTDVPDFLKGVYQRTEKLESPVVIIDSWEAVVTHTGFYEPREREKLEHNLCDFARKTGTRMIFVAEYTEQKPLDYLVDAVVVAESGMCEGRRIRTLQLQKLRGHSIRQPVYLFSLYDGLFTCFPAFRGLEVEGMAKSPGPIDDLSQGRLSTGIKRLDAAINGYGSFNLFSGDYTTYQILLAPFILNSLRLGRTLVVSPSARSLASKAAALAGGGLTKQIRLVPGIGELGKTVSALAEEIEAPKLVCLLNLDEMRQGEEGECEEVISTVTGKGGFCLSFVSGAGEISSQIESLASVSLVLQMLWGVPCLYGRIPMTGIYALGLETKDEGPEISVTPVI
jgi:KaiC/GvpD/RAD55 family RecA-like ATPase